MVRVLTFDRSQAEAIERYGSRSAAAVLLGRGTGPSQAYAVHLGPGGEIGDHETSFGQLFIVVDGRGWVRVDGRRHAVEAGQAAYLPRGTVHAKGSEDGMTAIMVQVYDLDPPDDLRGPSS